MDQTPRRWRVLVWFLIATVAAIGWVGAFLRQNDIANRENEIRHLQRQNLCIARMSGDFAADFGLALNTPPAPSTERDAAVARIIASANRLKASKRLCG